MQQCNRERNRSCILLWGLLLALLFSMVIPGSTSALAQATAETQQSDEEALKKHLVDVQTLDPTIIVELKYATKDNFFNKKLYSRNKAYLRPDAAKQLVKVQKHLKKHNMGLKIWDAYRPFSVQKIMWGLKPDARYVADPRTGSVHNTGGAVDVTLVDEEGNEMEMPTGFDDFSEKAHRDYSGGTWTSQHNRNTLRRAMEKFGFYSIETEWWHFNFIDSDKYEILDIPL